MMTTIMDQQLVAKSIEGEATSVEDAKEDGTIENENDGISGDAQNIMESKEVIMEKLKPNEGKFDFLEDDDVKVKGEEVFGYDFVGRYNELVGAWEAWRKKCQKRKNSDPLDDVLDAARTEAKAMDASEEETKQMVREANRAWLSRNVEAEIQEKHERRKIKHDYYIEINKAVEDVNAHLAWRLERIRVDREDYAKQKAELDEGWKDFNQRFKRLYDSNTILFAQLGYVRPKNEEGRDCVQAIWDDKSPSLKPLSETLNKCILSLDLK